MALAINMRKKNGSKRKLNALIDLFQRSSHDIHPYELVTGEIVAGKFRLIDEEWQECAIVHSRCFD